MIPEAAVEAAARALWQTNQHDDMWVDEFADYMDYLRAEATKALEATAPHLLVQGWDECADNAEDQMPGSGRILRLANPYRPTP